MAGSLTCSRCRNRVTRARIVVDHRYVVCGDCEYRRWYGDPPDASIPEQAVRTIEVVALFDRDLYLR